MAYNLLSEKTLNICFQWLLYFKRIVRLSNLSGGYHTSQIAKPYNIIDFYIISFKFWASLHVICHNHHAFGEISFIWYISYRSEDYDLISYTARVADITFYTCIITYIKVIYTHTYIFGFYNPSVWIIAQLSHTTHVVAPTV